MRKWAAKKWDFCNTVMMLWCYEARFVGQVAIPCGRSLVVANRKYKMRMIIDHFEEKLTLSGQFFSGKTIRAECLALNETNEKYHFSGEKWILHIQEGWLDVCKSQKNKNLKIHHTKLISCTKHSNYFVCWLRKLQITWHLHHISVGRFSCRDTRKRQKCFIFSKFCDREQKYVRLIECRAFVALVQHSNMN